ncbi:ATP-binding protein [Microcoleus vaginatus GB1-A2]|uniref:ATP-binding protein n=1 Tax=Microcoleus vaginatus TaxID=119532 RepID=UPI001683BE5E|nr:HAMP domain-containing protein [Microcoleus sp. FACHB-61]
MNIRHFGKTKAIGLQVILIVPFVLQIIGAVGIVGYLSFRNGQKAVNDLASQLRTEVSSRIDQHLDSQLNTARHLAQVNADAFDVGLIAPKDLDNVARFFWKQMQLFNVGYISFGAPRGEFAGSGYYIDRNIVVNTSNPTQRGNRNNYVYKADSQGNKTTLIDIYKNYQFQKELWYSNTVKARKPTWVLYQWEITPYPLAVSANRPIYNKNNQLIGVIGIDQRLSQISDFLRQIKVSKSGRTFIVERSGLIVASSSNEQPFKLINNNPERLNALESSDRLIQSTSQYLVKHFGDFNNIKDTQQLDFWLNKERQFVQVLPWKDEWGLDWLVVVAVPESDFMGQINANTRTTILLCLAALGVACGIGVLTSGWIARPILRLNRASEAITSGNFDQAVQDSRIQELNALANSFNHMATQLRESFTALEKSNAELEDRVEYRTGELKNALSELQRTQSQIIQSEKMSSLGQLVAGVAHEINNPVNFIHGNLVHTQEYTQDLLEFVQLYQQHYPNPADEIQIAAEEIDLEFLQEDLPKMLSSMKMGTDRIRQIVLSLRNFSRMDEAEFKPVDIHEGINSTLLILQHRLKDRPERPSIEVIQDYGSLPLVECYAGQLNQVFMNILTNAIDALEDGNASRTFQDIQANPNQIKIMTSVVDGRWVQIAIADNGPGMPQDIQQQIFNPFFTTKPIGKGTGMGMSISYQIVTEKHNGKLECFSTVGEGTQFVIQIPIR